ncbi:O-acetyl-ADP-ribose deacetylase [bacterium]|jgi:O-acetyl-ADP-ribose deacetylase|nr:O-acetyl-ADP-ribose deacetylase [bacterium]
MPSRIQIKRGDLTKFKVEALVNAANTTLLGGGGVDGAMHKAAGPGLLQECRALNGCATGDAKVTGGHNLYAKYVLHTVGPIWKDGKSGEPELLRSCYRTCFKLGSRLGLKTIAFPAISTGVYGYPLQEAAKIALEESFHFLEKNEFMDEVVHVCYNSEAYDIFHSVSKTIMESRKPRLFTQQDLDQILPDLANLDEFEHIDFSDMDLDSISNILRAAPVAKFLPTPSDEYKDRLPTPNEKGELEYKVEDKTLIVPAPYVSLVEFCFHQFGGNPSIVSLPDHNIFESIWDYIQQVVNWAISLEKTLYGQIYDMVKTLDSFAWDVQRDIASLEKDYPEDPIMSEIRDLPQLFEFACRLLVSKGISEEFRKEIALALLYLVSPIDFIPEGIVCHPVALADDAALLLFVFQRGLNHSSSQQKIMRRQWAGDPEFLNEVDQRLNELQRLLGPSFLPTLWTYLEGKIS